ncbi:MAG TPA: PDZ domain-containing protein [Candidatus Aquilonibacter sp.]|nr:PDZ domain-containing protein [Candidatus Aquilonibacter sp.]
MQRSIANALWNPLGFPFGRRPTVRHAFRLTLFCVAFSCCHAITTYNVSLADPEQHLVRVQIILPEGPAERELQLPVWNALYQIRDFSQYVDWVRAKDRAGRPLAVRAVNPSRWEITGAEQGAIVEYQIFADSAGPFGAQLNSHHAFFNLAEILMYPVDARSQPILVRFDQIPATWHLATPLTETSDGRFSADSYDRLVDSPVEIGSFRESDFDDSGAHYRVIVDADPGDYDLEKITAMLHKIAATAVNWMDDRPFDGYMFIYHFPHGPAGGGMEHAYSTAISLNADALARDPEILSSVTAHEFFHLWNVKRIRPQTLEPVDYTKENYTRALWFSEGCTSTAADFVQLRAGLLDERHFEQELSADIGELQSRPAHLTQSAEQSSLDAWLEAYPYYRRPERSVSYYNKGELLGVLLDLAVRKDSHGQASLREVFQWMNKNYAKKSRFFPDSDGVRQAAEAVSHSDLQSFFQKYVAGTEEVPWDDFFRVVGLHVVQTTNTVADAGFSASRNFDARMIVTVVTPGSQAELAGLEVGDTIVEINGNPPGQESAESVAALSPGDAIAVKIQSRRNGERELKWKVSGREEVSFDLKDLENVTSAQRAARAAWLKGEAQNSSGQ